MKDLLIESEFDVVRPFCITGVDWSDRKPLGLAESELHVWAFSLALSSPDLERLRPLLSHREQQRASRFAFPHLTRRYVASHVQMRWILARYTGAHPSALVFVDGPAGKPFLKRELDLERVVFNLAHSEEWGVLAVARTGDIGIDIERIRNFEGLTELACRSFAIEEFADLMQMPAPDRVEAFFACWTRKEAFIKADGRGLSLPLDSFAVAVDPNAPAALLSLDGSREATARFGLWDLQLVPNYRAAVAANRTNLNIRVMRLC